MKSSAAVPRESPAQEPVDALREFFGERVAGAIEGVFSRMELAEEEIEAAKRRHPRLAGRIHQAFLHLCPTPALSSAGEKAFRAHCRELLERVAAGEDLRPGTAAEVLSILSELSLAAPLDRIGTLLFVKLFASLFPEAAATMHRYDEPPQADRYEKERVAELEVSLRRKLSAADRVAPRRGTTPFLFK